MGISGSCNIGKNCYGNTLVSNEGVHMEVGNRNEMNAINVNSNGDITPPGFSSIGDANTRNMFLTMTRSKIGSGIDCSICNELNGVTIKDSGISYHKVKGEYLISGCELTQATDHLGYYLPKVVFIDYNTGLLRIEPINIALY